VSLEGFCLLGLLCLDCIYIFDGNKHVGLNKEAPLLGGVHVKERVLNEDLD
jgi:hypothetical protein